MSFYIPKTDTSHEEEWIDTINLGFNPILPANTEWTSMYLPSHPKKHFVLSFSTEWISMIKSKSNTPILELPKSQG